MPISNDLLSLYMLHNQARGYIYLHRRLEMLMSNGIGSEMVFLGEDSELIEIDTQSSETSEMLRRIAVCSGLEHLVN